MSVWTLARNRLPKQDGVYLVACSDRCMKNRPLWHAEFKRGKWVVDKETVGYYAVGGTRSANPSPSKVYAWTGLDQIKAENGKD